VVEVFFHLAFKWSKWCAQTLHPYKYNNDVSLNVDGAVATGSDRSRSRKEQRAQRATAESSSVPTTSVTVRRAILVKSPLSTTRVDGPS